MFAKEMTRKTTCHPDMLGRQINCRPNIVGLRDDGRECPSSCEKITSFTGVLIQQCQSQQI